MKTYWYLPLLSSYITTLKFNFSFDFHKFSDHLYFKIFLVYAEASILNFD